MTTDAVQKFLNAVNNDQGLSDGFVYEPSFEDYLAFPDPYARTRYSVKEVKTNGTYLSPKEALSGLGTVNKDSETAALLLENACFDRP